jgi:hypothetical protein
MNFGPLVDREETLEDLGSEMTALEIEISRQRLIRERSTYRLEQLLRERERVGRHLDLVLQEEAS